MDLDSSASGSASLAEIAPALGIPQDINQDSILSSKDLDDIKSAYVIRELVRRNKTIPSLCIAQKASGCNAAAARAFYKVCEAIQPYSLLQLQQLDLARCEVDDKGSLLLANALATRNANNLELRLLRGFTIIH